MSDKSNDNNIYDAATIQRYLNGQMPASEMHALELAALDDPFLADAIEGYKENQSHSEIDTSADLEDLRRRLTLRVESTHKNNIISLFKSSGWKVAAMILVIAGAVSMIYYLTNTRSLPNDVVISQYKTPQQKNNQQDTILMETENKVDSTSVATLEIEPQRYQPKAHKNLQLSKPRDTPVIVMQAPSPSMASASIKKKTDSLIVQNDSEDKVALLSENRIMQSRQATVSLNETSKKREEEKIKPLPKDQDAIPVIGLQAFNRYIENNKKNPSDTINMHGEVVVSFIVREDGALSDFKIEKSLSKQTDNEALRLIKEGPAWKVLKNQREKAVITIKF